MIFEKKKKYETDLGFIDQKNLITEKSRRLSSNGLNRIYETSMPRLIDLQIRKPVLLVMQSIVLGKNTFAV